MIDDAPVASTSAVRLESTTATASSSMVARRSQTISSPTLTEPASNTFGSARSNTSSAVPSNLGCRLLWRGRLSLGPKQHLNGVAIVAHVFAVPTISPSTTLSRSSPFPDDPFAAPSPSNSAFASSTTSAADLCLGLEMMRGSDIKVLSSKIKTVARTFAQSPQLMLRVDKGKTKEVENEPPVVVDTPTDLRIYIDPRCPETITWFENVFCRAGCEGNGIRLDAGGEEVIIFAPILPTSSISEDSSPFATLPPLSLLLGRAVKIAIRPPRPDDPMPRENLFANKLRRTNSMPALDFQSSFTSTNNSLVRTSSLASIKERSLYERRPRKLSTSKSLSLLLTAEASSLSGRSLQRSKSSSTKDPFTLTSIPLPTGLPKQSRPIASSSTSSSRVSNPLKSTSLPSQASRPLKRSRSMLSSTSSLSNQIVKSNAQSPPSSPTSEVSAKSRRRSSSLLPNHRPSYAIRDASPTPSVLSNTFDDEEDDEMDDRLPELGTRRGSTNSRSLSIGPAKGSIAGIRRNGLTRCESAPVGALKLGAELGVRRERERSTSVVPSGPEGIESRNKASLRKLLLSSILARGLTREDERFSETFSITLRGVQYALRESFKVAVLNKVVSNELIGKHLDMYLPTSTKPILSVKVEEEEEEGILASHMMNTTAGMPTPPRSLELLEVG